MLLPSGAIVACLLAASVSGALAVSPPHNLLNQPSFNPATGEMEDMEFRVAIEPGRTECFYQEAKKDHSLEVSYQVVEISSRFEWMLSPSGLKDLTIDFSLKGPQEEILQTEYQKQEGTHVHVVKEDGVFVICLGNTFSTVSSKLVNVEVYLYSSLDDDRWGYFEDQYTFSPEIEFQDSVETIKTSMNKVRDNLLNVIHSQDERRAIERRDRNLVEQNFDYINRFSLFSLTVMLMVGFVQLFLIRSLFEEKSILKKVFKVLSPAN